MMQQFVLPLILLSFLATACGQNNGFQAQQIDLPSIGDGQGGGDDGGGDDGEQPGPPTTLPFSQTLGKFDSNCQNNSNYDACIFWKNPLAKQNAVLSKYLDFGDDLSTRQTFGVKLQDQIDPLKLESPSIRVFTSNVNLPPGWLQPSNNSKEWKIAYAQETDKHWNAQVMAYFWLTAMEKHLHSRTGIYYAKNKNIPVNAYNAGVLNNAFWNGSGITIGAANDVGNNPRHELALSVEVVLHEMGHANLSHSGASGGGGTCSDQRGCMGAINEGQADFHYVMMFPTSTALGETSVNNLDGWSWRGISRDVRKLDGKKAADFYTAASGEIHVMGSLYAAILWDIYSHPTMVKQDFEKLFMLHLQKFTNGANFLTARDILLAEDQAHMAGKYQAVILAAFDKRQLE